MRRPHGDSFELAGQDSFVDVVTNLVGILIILVVLIGLKSQPKPEAPQLGPRQAAALAKLKTDAHDLHGDVRRVGQEIMAVRSEAASRAIELEQLATMIAVGQRVIQDERAKLDSTGKTQFDLNQQVAAARATAQGLQRDLVALLNSPGQRVEVRATLTPLSRTVFGREVHFHLRGGRVAFVPIEELFDEAKTHFHVDPSLIHEMGERVETAGPRGGFELQFTFDVQIDRRRGQVMIRSRDWQAVPVSDDVGELVADALQPASDFHRHLSLLEPKNTTVTIWVYADSFKEFGSVRDELHRLGYFVAGRPLPKGVPISGSPQGSKSAAQ